jgi:hypothetical protein
MCIVNKNFLIILRSETVLATLLYLLG